MSYANPYTSFGYNQAGQTTDIERVLNWDSRMTKAHLYVFTPKFSPNEVRRSHLYNFNENNLVHEIGEDILNKAATGDLLVNAEILDGTLSVGNAIVPSFDGQLINTSWFNNLWTFILIVDNERLVDNNPQSGIACRIIYTGYCLDEPVMDTAQFGKVAVNERAMLQITHQTYASIKDDFHSSFGNNVIAVIQQDRDIIAPAMVHATNASSNTSPDFLLDPLHVHNAINFNYGDDTVERYIGNAALKQYQESNYILPSNLNIPRKHLHTLFSPLYRTAREIAEAPMLAPTNQYVVPDITYGTWNGIYEAMKQNSRSMYHNTNREAMIGLDPKVMYSIGDLIQRYGTSLDIQPCRVNYELPVTPTDQMVSSPETIATSLLNTTIPPLMKMAGLSHAVFTYTSAVPSIIRLNVQDAVQIADNGLGTIIPESVENLQRRWNVFYDMFRKDVVEPIRAMRGEFEVYVSAQGSGFCNTQVQWLDGGIRNNEWNISNAVLGGISSPLLGSVEAIDYNTTNWGTVIPSVTNIIHGDNFQTPKMSPMF